MAAPKHRAILAAERATVVGARATHRSAPERAGEILSERDGVCTLCYTHETESQGKFNTYASYPLAELTLLP